MRIAFIVIFITEIFKKSLSIEILSETNCGTLGVLSTLIPGRFPCFYSIVYCIAES